MEWSYDATSATSGNFANYTNSSRGNATDWISQLDDVLFAVKTTKTHGSKISWHYPIIK
jgi:hypothetical protein